MTVTIRVGRHHERRRTLARLGVLAWLALAGAATPAIAQETAPRRPIGSPLGAVRLVAAGPAIEQCKWTLWVAYPDAKGMFADQRTYLGELQSRWQERGVRVAALFTAEAAGLAAESKPNFMIASLDEAEQQPLERLRGRSDALLFLQRHGEDQAPMIIENCDGLDGLADAVHLALDGEDEQSIHNRLTAITSLLMNVADGGPYGQQAKDCVEGLPASGRARACVALCHWWCEGNLEAAKQAVNDGVDALAHETLPMTIFCDLVLRGDRNDPAIARSLAIAMTPIATSAEAGTFAQLVYLRALLRAGQDRLAGRVIAGLANRIGDNARNQIIFAETLMDAGLPDVHRDLAQRAQQRAAANGGDRRWFYAAQHKILARCGDNEQAEELMEEYRKAELNPSTLNNDAWYLMVQPPTMGRFDTFALAQADKMARDQGDSLHFGSKDTVALACFLNGQTDRAIELQREATTAGGNQEVYAARRERYEATKAMRADAKSAPPPQRGR